MIEELGADHVVVSTDPEQMKAVANTFDFIITTLPSNNGFGEYVKTAAPGGVMVQVGVPRTEEGNCNFNLFDIVGKAVSIVGSCVGPRTAIKKMINICVEKNIYPIVEVFDFEDFPKAFDHLEKGKPHFRSVVNVKDWAEKHGFKK